MNCVAVWSSEGYSSGGCAECAHLLPCHVEGGCHFEGCACENFSRVVCGIELVENPAGECAEWEGDYRCRDVAANHCPAADPYALHLCHADMAHHTFVTPFKHATEPKWDHRIEFPRVAPTRPPLVLKPILRAGGGASTDGPTTGGAA